MYPQRVNVRVPKTIFFAVLLVFSVHCTDNSEPDCLDVHERGVSVQPPAGVRVLFSVTDCEGAPVRQLEPGDVKIINGATGKSFGEGGEGGGASAPTTPSGYGLFTVLSLDMSGSIFERNAVFLKMSQRNSKALRRVTT
jgi:hypothetical protein